MIVGLSVIMAVKSHILVKLYKKAYKNSTPKNSKIHIVHKLFTYSE